MPRAKITATIERFQRTLSSRNLTQKFAPFNSGLSFDSIDPRLGTRFYHPCTDDNEFGWCWKISRLISPNNKIRTELGEI